MRALAAAICAVLLAMAEPAAAELGGRIGLATAEMFRGIKQTEDGIGANGLLQYDAPNGLYAAVWTGRVEYPYSREGSDVEVDYIAGLGFTATPHLQLDTSIVRYTYPTSDLDYDWTEWYTSARLYQGWTIGIGVARDWLGGGKTTEVVELTYRSELPFGFTFDATGGYQNVSAVIGEDYSYYEFGLARTLLRCNFRIALISSDSAARNIFGDAAATRWVGSMSWAF